MKKLSIKWKLFLILSYVQLVGFGLFFIIMLFFSFSSEAARADYRSFIIAFFLFLFLCMNSALNIHTINRYFPNKLISSSHKRLLLTSWVINILTLAGLILISIIVMYYQLTDVKVESATIAWTLALTLSFLSIISIYTFILQFQIISFLNRNNASKMNDLIDSIGT